MNSSHKWCKITICNKIHDSKPFDDKAIIRIQGIISKFSYHTRELDNITLPTSGSSSTIKIKGIDKETVLDDIV